MRHLLFTALALFYILSVSGQQELNVMTFNIRFDNARDSLNAWTYRKEKAASQVVFHKVHLLGVQEALHHQLEDLKASMGHYKYIGVGRADGKQKGEYSAIFYDSSRLQLLQTETFWLAEQTDVPGKKGWDAAIERIVTWAKFRDRKTRKVFYHFNTHFDHIGKVARRESSKLLLRKVKELAGDSPIVITGDFNAMPGDEPIQVLVDKSDPNRFTDAKEISAKPHYGPTGTFNGFKSKEQSAQPIDYIFVKNKIKVLQHATLSQTWEGRFSSDHFPVFAVLTW
ncbi:MAG TPA: endonuclease/exonuclease/phosphatase family protein [Segetibacter sp.]|jgi:endonuclease/exonuclease/phosphatase family metal-dependent hydrolase